MNGKAKSLLPLGVLAAAAVAAAALLHFKPTAEKTTPEIFRPLVRAERIALADHRYTVHSEGTVAPRTEIDVSVEASGRVVEVSSALKAGGFFEAGDLLLALDPRDYEDAAIRARAQASREALRLQQEIAEGEAAREDWETLGAGEAPSLALRAPQREEAEAALAAAQAAVAQAERDLSRTILLAPFAGHVRSVNVDVGQYVSRGAPVARIYAVDAVEIRLPIPDSELAYLGLPLNASAADLPEAGPEVALYATFAGSRHAWTGRIVRTEGTIDPRTRMVTLVARVDDPYGPGDDPDRPPLAAGLFVEAEIAGRIVPRVAVIPRAALRGPDRVLVIDGEGRLRFRTVRVLRLERDVAVVGEGLAEGERICLSHMEAPVDGMAVDVRDEAPR